MILLPSSDSFAVEEKKAVEAIDWINSYAKKNDKKFEAKLEGYSISTIKFGTFQIISWKGEWSFARNVILRVSSKLGMKVIESGYHQQNHLLLSLIGVSKEVGKVYNKGNFLGYVIMKKKSGKWQSKTEKLG